MPTDILKLTRFILVDAAGLLMLAGSACVAATPFYSYGPGAFTTVDWVSYAGFSSLSTQLTD